MLASDPFQRYPHVEDAQVGRVFVLVAISRQIQIAQNVEAVIDGYDHHVAFFGQIFTIIGGQFL